MDRVFLGKMPDLQAERIGADAGRDPATHPDRAPGATHAFLPRIPLLQRLQRAHAAPDPDPSPVPSVQAAAERELSQRAVEASLVVDLIGGQVGDDVFDAPATAVAPDRPLRALQGAKVGAQAGNLAVVDRKGISASWIELACACRGRALPLPSPNL